VAISDEMAKAILKTSKELGISVKAASLLSLDKAMETGGGDARGYGKQIAALMSGIADGSVPAKKGVEQLGKAFTKMADEAKAAGRVGDAVMVGILQQARAAKAQGNFELYTPEMAAHTAAALDKATEGLKKYVAGLAKMMSGAGGTKADVEKWFKIYKDKYDALKKLGENLTADQAKEMAQLQQLMNAQGDKLATGKFGDGKALGATLGTNAAIVFMGTFNALVSEKGWVAAVEALSGTFDQLKTAMGASMTPAMEAIFAQFERLQGYLNNDTFSGAISAVDGLTQVMIGLADAGYLNVETFAAMQGSAFDLFTAMVDGGMAAGDAIAVMAPLIQAAVSAAEQFGIPLSADMQHLKDLAEQNGITFKTDPMQRMVEILTAIANVLGATLPDAANKAAGALDNVARNRQATVDITYRRHNEGEAPGDLPPDVTAATGFYSPMMGRGKHAGGMTVLGVHPGEEVYVGPKGAMPSTGAAAAPSSQPVQVVVNIGPEQLYNMLTEATRTGEIRVHSDAVRKW
jgi:hypothetical protein